MKICSNCVLPQAFPGISYNQNGVCNFCQEFKGKEHLEKEKTKYRKANHRNTEEDETRKKIKRKEKTKTER